MSLEQYQLNVTESVYQVILGSGPVGTQVARAGAVYFSQTAQQVSVSFPTPLPNNVTDYALVVSLQNTLDSFPQDLVIKVSAFTVNGFTVKANAITDSPNYLVNWMVVARVNG